MDNIEPMPVLRPDMEPEVSTVEQRRRDNPSPGGTTLISTWEEFGFRRRGDWSGRRNFSYKKKDVVCHPDRKTFWVCQEDHESDEGTEPGRHYFWKKWGK